MTNMALTQPVPTTATPTSSWSASTSTSMKPQVQRFLVSPVCCVGFRSIHVFLVFMFS